MIICGCRVKHADHTFKPKEGSWGLCTICSHSIGSHKAGAENPQVRELLDLISNAKVGNVVVAPLHTTPGRVQVTVELDLS